MDIRTAEDKTAVLEALLNEARIEGSVVVKERRQDGATTRTQTRK